VANDLGFQDIYAIPLQLTRNQEIQNYLEDRKFNPRRLKSVPNKQRVSYHDQIPDPQKRICRHKTDLQENLSLSFRETDTDSSSNLYWNENYLFGFQEKQEEEFQSQFNAFQSKLEPERQESSDCMLKLELENKKMKQNVLDLMMELQMQKDISTFAESDKLKEFLLNFVLKLQAIILKPLTKCIRIWPITNLFMQFKSNMKIES